MSELSEIKYFCPMHCEGDRVYDKPGRCPVCGMYLVPVNKADLGHTHEGHNEKHTNNDSKQEHEVKKNFRR
jgi:Cu2+-exporting ATPase